MTITQLFDRYIASRPELSELSHAKLRHSGKLLERYLSGPVKGITPARADDAKAKMLGAMRPVSAANNVRFARQVWAWALARKEVPENPWAGVKVLVRASDEPAPEVPADVVARVMAESSPDVACLLALCRFAGLRKSEALHLDWPEVKGDELIVRARGGEVTTKQATRRVPISGRLAAALKRAEGLASPTGNLRNDTHFAEKVLAAMDRAGVTPWPKMLQTLRANCETDWRAHGIDTFDVCKWMGHSVSTAYKHYYIARKESAQKLREM